MHKILVVPSIRESSIKSFLDAWKTVGDWDEVILVEDNPNPTFDVEGVHHFSWKDIESSLGKDQWVISRRDSAIRSFGFLKAYAMGADYILTLDDDCYPYDDKPIFKSHIDRMLDAPKWVESIPGMRTRGLPYLNKGKMTTVVANMGLWSKIPDLDSVQSLNDLEAATGGNFIPPTGSRIIPAGQYFPLCGMNFAFSRSVTPLAYFPLMGMNSPYGRFDDIWFGVIFKKIIDHLGLHVSVGDPFVEHQRASNIMVNLVKEAPGIAVNEWFWNKIDAVKLVSTTPVSCMKEIGVAIQDDDHEYISRLGQAICVWSSLF